VNPLWRRVQRRREALERTLPATHIDVFGFLRPAYRCLEENGVLGLAFDGGGGTKWIDVAFGPRRAWVSTQQLARATGAQILPSVVVREVGEERHRLIFDAPVTVPSTRSREADLRAAAQNYADWFYRWVLRHPDHYAHYLLLRRRVRHTDLRPFFDDYS
jgi:lauroyl/myristoyl acyltransferase